MVESETRWRLGWVILLKRTSAIDQMSNVGETARTWSFIYEISYISVDVGNHSVEDQTWRGVPDQLSKGFDETKCA